MGSRNSCGGGTEVLLRGSELADSALCHARRLPNVLTEPGGWNVVSSIHAPHLRFLADLHVDLA